MTVKLSPEHQQFIEQQVKAGHFRSADDVVGIALQRMRSAMSEGDFEPGELAALVAEGEADVQRGDVVDGEEAFRRIRSEMRVYRDQHVSKG